MEIIKKIKNMDSKFSWSFLGFLIGIFGLVFSIYFTFFYEASPELIFKETTNTDVIDMREDVSEITIKYEDKIIDNKNNNLKIVTFVVSNQGNKNILNNDYDLYAPIGFTVKNGYVVDNPSVISASNSYLKENVKITRKDNKYIFPEVIIERNQEFTIKMLILTSNNQTPKIIPCGKIAGMDKIKMVSVTENSENTFFKDVFYGGVVTQIIRTAIYFIIGLIILGLIVFFVDAISEAIRKYNKARVIGRYKKSNNYNENQFYEIIFEIYRQQNVRELGELYGILSDEEKLQDIRIYENISKKNVMDRSNEQLLADDLIMEQDMRLNYMMMRNWRAKNIKKLLEAKIISKENGVYKVEECFVTNLSHFYNFAIFFK